MNRCSSTVLNLNIWSHKFLFSTGVSVSFRFQSEWCSVNRFLFSMISLAHILVSLILGSLNLSQACKLGHVRLSGQCNICLTPSRAFFFFFFCLHVFLVLLGLLAWYFCSYLINQRNKNMKSFIFCYAYFYCFSIINKEKKNLYNIY